MTQSPSPSLLLRRRHPSLRRLRQPGRPAAGAATVSAHVVPAHRAVGTHSPFSLFFIYFELLFVRASILLLPHL